MKTATAMNFEKMPKDYQGLVMMFMPRAIHDKVDYENTVEVMLSVPASMFRLLPPVPPPWDMLSVPASMFSVVPPEPLPMFMLIALPLKLRVADDGQVMPFDAEPLLLFKEIVAALEMLPQNPPDPLEQSRVLPFRKHSDVALKDVAEPPPVYAVVCTVGNA